MVDTGLRTLWTRRGSAPLRAFVSTESASAVVLVAAVVVALVWANAAPASYAAVWDTRVALRIGAQPWLHRFSGLIVGSDKALQRVTRGRITLLTFAGLPELLLQVPGRKTGVLRSTPLLCVPHGDGWLVRVRLSDPGETDGLMDVEAYTQHLAEQG